MRGVLTIATLAVGLGAGTQLLADQKAENCKKFSGFAAELLELRREGLAEMDALLAFADKHQDESPNTLQIVATINPWVFTLDDTIAPKDVETAFHDQCLAQPSQ